MTTATRRLGRAIARARDVRSDIARELRLAREQAGLSQDAAGRAVGLSGSQIGRIERGEIRGLTIDQVCRASAAVGMRSVLRLYPDDDPIRDAGQLRLLERFRERVSTAARWRGELPVSRAGDLRSWDAALDYPTARDAIEAETRIRDAQAVARRTLTKLRDDPTVSHVILLVADTNANRRAIEAATPLLRAEFPLDSRAAFRAVGRGEPLAANAIVFL